MNPNVDPDQERKPRRNVADTVALYVILLVVAFVALGPLNARDVPPEVMTLAGKPPVAAEQATDAER